MHNKKPRTQAKSQKASDSILRYDHAPKKIEEAKTVERNTTAFKPMCAFGEVSLAPDVLVLVSELDVEVDDFFLSVVDTEVSDEVGYDVAVAVAFVEP